MSRSHDAMLWESVDNSVRCGLCAHRCMIGEGQFGICRVRQNIGGSLKTHSYGRIIAANADPIEKKPLFHFLPGTLSFSIATLGCNFRCDFCQNWQISQIPDTQSRSGHPGRALSPEALVNLAKGKGCASISYTYTEPTVFFELAYDTAGLAKPSGLGNCFVSNGYMTPEAVDTIAPRLDAINVDLKAFRDETYRKVCGGGLQPVLDCLRRLVEKGVWVEVTTLVVPGMNDSTQELSDIAGFIADELGPDVPWHVSKFHGDYKQLDTPATSIAALELACRLGRQAGLRYVYCGNVMDGQADENTYCPDCRELLIERAGFCVRRNLLDNGMCPKCSRRIAGIWNYGK